MQPPPLEYAPPPTVRRGAIRCGVLAHVIASYPVGLFSMTLAVVNTGVPIDSGLVAFAAASPLWVPVSYVLVILFKGGGVYSVACIGAYVALFAVAYRHLRKPRGA